MHEKILSSEKVYEGKLINARKDEIRLKNKIFIREVVEHPGSVAIVPLLNNGSIVMIEQYRYPVKEVLLEIPAGTLEINENAIECANRELIEETGYKAGNLRKLMSCYLAPGYSTELTHIFLATEIKDAKQRLENDESIRVITIKLPEVKKMIKDGIIKDAKTIIGVTFLDLNKEIQ
jgi:ADP-ribose pyrophosphatase